MDAVRSFVGSALPLRLVARCGRVPANIERGGRAAGANAAADQVANGVPIIWHVAESAAADAMRALLKEAKVQELTIVHTP
jgi:hypothetical protein